VLIGKDQHIWWPIGQYGYSMTSKQYRQAEATLYGLSLSWIGICAFEFLMLICGSSVPEFLLQINLLQVVIHFMGVLFTTWFLLDSWRFVFMWPLWAIFAIPAFLLELYLIQQSFKLKSDIRKNLQGIGK